MLHHAATWGIACALVAGCVAEPPPRDDAVLRVAIEQQASWVQNFNPLMPGARRPARAGIYEPLLIHNALNGEWVPWLATVHEWLPEAKGLRFRIRAGVTWSDGEPFTAHDVAFTFRLLKRFPAFDQAAVWRFVARVEAPDDRTFVAHFSRPYSPGLGGIAHQPIVPRHIWRGIDDPVRFTNPDPVGTGPFTEVTRFQTQVYRVARNPRYWQPGLPKVEALEFLAYLGNDQANLALVTGEVDWAGNFVPAIDRTFVARDPAHRGYWFPLVGNTVFLYANTTQPPLSDRRVRKALSLALDRDLLVRVAMYGTTRPADVTALSDAHRGFRDDVLAAEPSWVRHDDAAAARLLDAAGVTMGSDGARVGPGGTSLELTILVVSGWSDWVRAAQIIARELRGVGVTATVQTLDFSPWFERVQRGDFDLAIGWSTEAPTPYGFYRWLMDPETVTPIGTAAPGNWHRYGSRVAQEHLRAFERTADPAAQRVELLAVQRAFAEEAPAIPLFPNPVWGAFNTTRVTGFPTADNPYAPLSPNPEPSCLLVLTRLTPRGR